MEWRILQGERMLGKADPDGPWGEPRMRHLVSLPLAWCFPHLISNWGHVRSSSLFCRCGNRVGRQAVACLTHSWLVASEPTGDPKVSYLESRGPPLPIPSLPWRPARAHSLLAAAPPHRLPQAKSAARTVMPNMVRCSDWLTVGMGWGTLIGRSR